MTTIIQILSFSCGIIAFFLGEQVIGMLFMIMMQLSIIIDKLEEK